MFIFIPKILDTKFEKYIDKVLSYIIESISEEDL